MEIWNATSFHPDYFFLVGLPGMEDSHLLMSIPFSIMFVLALLGNSILISVISANEILRQPMYIFLMALAVSDTLLSCVTTPKTLSIFWFGSHEISFNGCLTGMFFIHFTFGIESVILLLMAYDRYCAICYPLTYATTLTNAFIVKTVMLGVLRSFCLVAPLTYLINRLPFQQSNVLAHTYCEHMSLAKLATADILVNVVYGLVIVAFSSASDMVLIVVSYVVIIKAVLRLPTSEARFKAFNTCVSHICVILLFYIPAFFSFIAHRVGHQYISLQFHIIFANLYVLIPPMMNPIIYGVRTRELQERTFVIFSRLTSKGSTGAFFQKH